MCGASLNNLIEEKQPSGNYLIRNPIINELVPIPIQIKCWKIDKGAHLTA